MAPRELPIWEIHADILAALQAGRRLVLVAPTGSGKTTQVPQMLLEAGLAGEGRIVVLQPRRVAARTVAARVAWERQCKLGEEVGYQIRFDDQTGLGTRICFVTEGILLRWLQDDASLRGVSVVLFDEFHERNLLSDVALGLVKHLQETRRPDLKLAVMSATLEAEPVAVYLGGCPVLTSEGRSYDVEVRYLEHKDERPVTDQAADAVENFVNSGGEGDVLVFMAGMAEINSTINALRAARTNEALNLIPLHGDLAPEDQDRAFSPSLTRKVVVATNVAETSVTIDGIRCVVDGGMARVARHDAERGLGTLHVEEISRASADQRKGRAGRTAPGVCFRLWTESGHLNRPERNTPEIQRSDLAEVVLLLYSLGISKAATFDWLDKPEPAAVEQAERLLEILGALETKKRVPQRGTFHSAQGCESASYPGLTGVGDANPEGVESPNPSPPTPTQVLPLPQGEGRGEGEATTQMAPGEDQSRLTSAATQEGEEEGGLVLTPVGWKMLRLPMHPRYSRMMVEAAQRGAVKAAALCAALVSGRDLLVRIGREDQRIAEAREVFEGSAESDFHTLMRAFEFARRSNFSMESCRRYGIHAATTRQVDQTFQQILEIAERLGRPSEETPSPADETKNKENPLARCILAGFVDQLCKRRDEGTLECDVAGGRHGTLMRESVVQLAPLFVAAAIREVTSRNGVMTLLGLATAVKKEWVAEMFPQHLSEKVDYLYDRAHKRVAAVRFVRCLDLIIEHEHQREMDPLKSGRCLADAHLRGFFELPLFNHELKQLVARANLVAVIMPELEFPAFHQTRMATCLARAFSGMSLAKEAQAARLESAFYEELGKERRTWLDEMAPVSFAFPDGRKFKLTYGEGSEGAKAPPEAQVKLHECFALTKHPTVCEGRLAARLWLCSPEGKRLASTQDWSKFRVQEYPKLKPALQKKYPGFLWL